MRYVEGLTSVEGGYERTGARSPMQWDNGVNAGFSAAPTDKIYIRQDPASDRPTVAGQLDDGESLLNHVRRLIELRQAHSALQSRSGITFVSDGAPKRPLVYKRGNDEETLLVAINPYREEVSFRLDRTLGGALGLLLRPLLGGGHRWRRWFWCWLTRHCGSVLGCGSPLC